MTYRQFLLSNAFSLVLLACYAEPKDPVPSEDTEGIITSSGGASASTGGTDTGGTDTDDVLVNNGCLNEGVPGTYGFVHQCEGRIFATFSASGLSSNETVFFGDGEDGDAYTAPKVMACCDPYDSMQPWGDQPHGLSCYYDMVETLCRSLSGRIVDAAKDAPLGIKNQATALANFIASEDGQEECKFEFREESGLSGWGIDDTGVLQHTWNVKNHPDWDDIVDPTLSIDAEMTGLFLPASPEDRLECVDNGLSDSQSFLTANDKPSDFVYTLGGGDATLVGPSFSGGSLTAAPTLASQRTACSTTECSTLRLTSDAGQYVLDALRLESFGPTVVSNRDTNVTVDRFRIELVGPLPADVSGTDTFTIDREGAVFMVTGLLEGFPHIIPVKNVTAIRFTKNGSRWDATSFALQHVDSDGSTWDFTVAAASWH